MDRTVKIPAYSGAQPQGAAQDNLTKEQKMALELATKNTQLEEEKNKSLEQLKTIEQLRESLKQEQLKSLGLVKKAADLESKVDDLLEVLTKISAMAAAGKAE